jgi:hypothetical protein
MKPLSKDSRVIYAAALWALIFCTLHLMWAAGLYIGLEVESAREAFQRTWFWWYNLIIAGICLLGVAVALAMLSPRILKLPRRLVIILAWAGTGLLALRGGAGLIQIIYFAAVGRNIMNPMILWDFWFLLGALLFGLSNRLFMSMVPKEEE